MTEPSHAHAFVPETEHLSGEEIKEIFGSQFRDVILSPNDVRYELHAKPMPAKPFASMTAEEIGQFIIKIDFRVGTAFYRGVVDPIGDFKLSVLSQRAVVRGLRSLSRPPVHQPIAIKPADDGELARIRLPLQPMQYIGRYRHKQIVGLAIIYDLFRWMVPPLGNIIGLADDEPQTFIEEMATIAAGPNTNFYVDFNLGQPIRLNDMGPSDASARADMLVDLFTSIGLSGVEWELVEGELYRIDRNIQLQVEPVTAEDRTAILSRWLADARLPDEAKSAMAELYNSVGAESV